MEGPDATVDQLFGEALEMSREERGAFLDRVCAGRPEEHRQVQLLLDENDRLTGYLRESPWKAAAGSGPSAIGGPQPGSGAHLGRYLLAEPLGAGGMGVVYRARDEKLERTVAVKILTPGVLTNETMRSHFRREALALARLNHPNIAALYDVGEQDGVDFIVMELVQGEPLRKRLQSGPLAAEAATRIAVEIAEALEEAHAQGVVHRDLKPANVMITPRGHAKVLDFGVAKLLTTSETTQSLPETSGVVGTPLYMSPEQALGKEIDVRTDVWSLGAVYYEMLTGRPPFEGASAVAILHSITKERFTPVRQLRPDAPEEAEDLVSRALRKDPVRRYATAEAMGRDASRLLTKLSGSVPAAEVRSSTRKLRLVAAALALLLVAGMAAGWWLYHGMVERRWAREEAIPQIESLLEARHAVPAFNILQREEKDLPGDAHLAQMAKDGTERVTIRSEPAGAEVSIQD